jgi:hypothetical protein
LNIVPVLYVYDIALRRWPQHTMTEVRLEDLRFPTRNPLLLWLLLLPISIRAERR